MEPKVLDINATPKTSYCVPLWLRDENIKVAIKKVQGRITEVKEPRGEPVAIVCFGPSLNQTWEKLRDFKYIISCSGAHKFLIERGIIPTWHVEVDPRAHKVELLGPPHPDVTYLPASTCHPDYFDHLIAAKAKIELWHVFDNAEDAMRTMPRGDWLLTGGASVGLRCFTVARLKGFRDLHVFGMDGNFGESGSHSAEHPNGPPSHSVVELKGVTYKTTASMLACAQQTAHEMDMLSDVKATFYGEGLTQALMADYKRGKAKKGVAEVGVCKPELISAEYAEMNARLHAENLAFGVGGGKHAKTVLGLVEKLKKHTETTPSVLDYGCGKGYLAKELPFPIWEYDPAIPEKSESPRPADLVVCTDVLEHIEPDKILLVLDDLRRCTKKIGFFVIHTGPSMKTLPDGRNAHILQRDKAWWTKMLTTFFNVGQVFETGPLVYVVVEPKKVKKAKAA